jgi:hypothetical protein
MLGDHDRVSGSRKIILVAAKRPSAGIMQPQTGKTGLAMPIDTP